MARRRCRNLILIFGDQLDIEHAALLADLRAAVEHSDVALRLFDDSH